MLQETIDNVLAFCTNWGLSLNKSKTVYTVFTTAGHRESYERINKLKLTICNQLIPIDPYPKFLGIHLDPKLSFTHHFDYLPKRVNFKINLLKKIKSLGWHQNNKIFLTIYKTLIRSLFDYSFIPLCCDTQKIISKYEKLQNRILRIIKWFPLKIAHHRYTEII